MKKHTRPAPDHIDERAERLARLDVSTFSATELELIEAYRGFNAAWREHLMTLVKFVKAGLEKAGA